MACEETKCGLDTHFARWKRRRSASSCVGERGNAPRGGTGTGNLTHH